MFKKGKTFSKKRRFDYARKNFENPFFKKQKRISAGPELQAKLLLASVLLMFGGLAWFLLFSPLWKIEEVSVNGLQRMDEKKIINTFKELVNKPKFGFIPGSNYLLLSSDEVASVLMDKYHFKNISVKKIFPDGVSINLQEKPFACIWEEDGHFYHIDDDGYILEEINDKEAQKNEYPIINNKTSRKISQREANIENSYIKFILRLFEEIKNYPLELKNMRFIVDDTKETVKISYDKGPIIKFSTRNGIKEQIEKLIIIKNEKLKDDFQNKKYVDLRYGDKIYFQ